MNVRTATMEDVGDVKHAPTMPPGGLQPNRAMPVAEDLVYSVEATLALMGQPIVSADLRTRHDPQNLVKMMMDLEVAAKHPLDLESIKERDGWRATYPGVLRRAEAKVASLKERWKEYESIKAHEITAQNLHAAMRETQQIQNDRSRRFRREQRKRDRENAGYGPGYGPEVD